VNDEPDPNIEPDEPEEVDGLPVLSSDDADTAVTPAEPAGALIPGRQVAALAATGFVAGAATVALVHRRRTKLPRRFRKKKGGGRVALGDVVSSNSFLVDVHLLRRD
jgi:hypothetical protein